MNNKICFIGGGNMAEAMVAGLISREYDAKNIFVIDRNESKRASLENKYKIQAYDKYDVLKECGTIVIAIKPQQVAMLIAEIKDYITQDQLIITIAAGIEVCVYEKLFGKPISLARTIPNTPCSLGYGATGVYFNQNVSLSQQETVINIMQTMGIAEVVNNESMIDVIAACAGSGPAYYLQFMEHMVDAAIKQGLDRAKAERLITQTCLGAAKMALNSGQTISKLRENVTSAKGITAEALNVFAKSKLDNIVDNAIQANISRSKEISKELSE